MLRLATALLAITSVVAQNLGDSTLTLPGLSSSSEASTAVAAASTASAPAPSTSQTADEQTTVSSSQYWHERYHGLLSMAAYNPNFEDVCTRQTFTQEGLLKSFPDSTEAPWTLISRWGPTASGLEGFDVIIPEMDKIVTVFKGLFGWEQLNMTSTPLEPDLSLNCTDCKAHAGALQAYLEAKEVTNDWAVAKQAVEATGHQWSITGHGFGGMVGIIASLDLGWRGLVRWTHAHGTARTVNPAAANLFNSLFAGEAGQRTVANNDIIPTIIPPSEDYVHTLEGFHIFGTNTTYGMNFNICKTDGEDPECLGGDSIEDHYFYYTPIGQCGSPNTANDTLQDPVISSLSAAFYATATSTYVLPSSTVVPSSTLVESTTETSAPVATDAQNAAAAGTGTAAQASASAGSQPANGATALSLSSSLAALVVIAGAFAVVA